MLTIRDLADRLRVSPATISRWWRAGVMPQPLRVRRTLRWREAVIDKWLAENPDLEQRQDTASVQ